MNQTNTVPLGISLTETLDLIHGVLGDINSNPSHSKCFIRLLERKQIAVHVVGSHAHLHFCMVADLLTGVSYLCQLGEGVLSVSLF